ncbi:MAG: rod shape-determining protein [Candidatus Wildermuthbacteria bacterium RIFCSPHIGHO2_01_FULL_49_22b]|uniref:Cell shape-determining protein MreB n=1 Tax=Candidatus Wildermuthbacteria bacterium RIFCSPHIGHO2_01_FULL_49_22b TaxID=1802448 RepID=A0A1G2QYH7_9BACT|nr:MAG: rod shape-determining protein [Candidatus Wildermuthbacteria bacterium RIFCSPHIGHO2_01_FULL_49_22b]
MSYLGQDIAIDLGTANSLVYVRDRGIVIQEPSVVAVNQKTGQILAIGSEAKKMVGRTPAHIVATRPLVKGVISDFEVTEQMLRYFINKVARRKLLFSPGPRVIVGIPFGVTEVEKKAVQDATLNAGAREVYLIDEPMAAAIGSRLAVQEAGGNFIVDIGGGTAEVAIISLGGIVTAKSLRIAGDKLNEDIIQFAQEEYKLLIGERTAEALKIGIGSAYPLKEKKEMPLRGRNLVSGLPEEIMVSDVEVRKAMERSVRQIVGEIKAAVEQTPPELLADIMVGGIHLSGGGALLRGLDTLIAKETKIPTATVEDPLTAVVRGAGMVLENLDELQDVLVETNDLEPPR